MENELTIYRLVYENVQETDDLDQAMEALVDRVGLDQVLESLSKFTDTNL